MNMICIVIIIALLVVLALGLFVGKPYLDNKQELEFRRVENEKLVLFSGIDTAILKDTLNTWVDDKIHEYILYRLRIGEKEYITGEESELLVSTVTNALYIELSELYLFYIKLLVNIETDDDVLTYLNTLVKTRAILIISDINKIEQ